MVLTKASIWYETVLRPLRRLTSATADSLFVTPRQQSTASNPSQPKAAQEFRADASTAQEGAFGRPSKQQSGGQEQKQNWREFLKNPLDVMLNSPDHSANMINQRLNQPFSTSVTDQARKSHPEKRTPCTCVERPVRRSSGTMKHIPKPCERQKDCGSRKYRKYFRCKTMRKGPHYNIRRRNRLCIQSYLEDPYPSVDFNREWRQNVADSTLGNTRFINSAALSHGKDVTLSTLCKDASVFSENFFKGKGGTLAMNKMKESASSLPYANVKSQIKEVVSSLPNLSEAEQLTYPSCICDKTQSSDTLNNVGTSSKLPEAQSQTNAPEPGTSKAIDENGSKFLTDKETCCSTQEIRQEVASGWSKTLTSMRNNLQEATESFKCSLWKRAISGDTVFQTGFRERCSAPCCTNSVPCCAAAKVY